VPGLDLFEKLSMVEVARVLDLHPFELARLLGAGPALPRVLSFEETDIERLRQLAGVENWWDGGALPEQDESHQRSLVRSLAHKIVEQGLPGGAATRADNLFRGLEGDDRSFVRRVVNQLIRERLATSSSSARGLLFHVDEEDGARLAQIAKGENWSSGLEELCS